MLNQFVYCPRLAYLQWVQSEWQDNEFTADGQWVHRRVDRSEGWLPQPEEMQELPFRSRSVSLSAPVLGLSTRLDLLDAEAEEAIPVEYKRGRAPEDGSAAHPSDLVQLLAQALVLQELGWKVERGFFYYAESRERVELVFSPQQLAWAQEVVGKARQALSGSHPPPPLVADSKCVHCSLAPICLPDEVHLLTSNGPDGPVRQLLAPTDDALPLYLHTPGLSVGIAGELLEVREKGKTIATSRWIDTSQLVLFGNIQVSTQAVRELAQRGVPICYFSGGGWFSAMTQGLGHKNVELRQAQFRAAFSPEVCLALAQRLVSAKIMNARTLLRRNARGLDPAPLRELKRLTAAAEAAPSLPTLLGLEGMASRIYFQSFSEMLKNERFLRAGGFDSSTRNRRPPKDPLNALLSFVYALLVKELTVTAAAIGFDPHQGFYHQPRYGKPALALDLMEEFRALIADSTVISVINNQVVDARDFQRVGDGVSMTVAARRRVTEAFERRLQEQATHPWFGYRLSYRRILYVQTRLLARFLLGEIEVFPPFLTR